MMNLCHAPFAGWTVTEQYGNGNLKKCTHFEQNGSEKCYHTPADPPPSECHSGIKFSIFGVFARNSGNTIGNSVTF
jgi:hypothetical protein